MRQLRIATGVFTVLMVFGLIFWGTGCKNSTEVRKYKESNQTAPPVSEGHHSGMTRPGGMGEGVASPPQNHFKWQTPSGWTEEKATSSFRLATFTIQSGSNTGTCTIVPLQGEAGGLKANASRWLGQITGQNGHTDPMLAEGDPKEVDKIMEKKESFLTSGQFAAILLDFTPATPKPTDNSILATVITVANSSVFIKMMGPKSLLQENKAKFKELCLSFDVAPPTAAASAHGQH